MPAAGLLSGRRRGGRAAPAPRLPGPARPAFRCYLHVPGRTARLPSGLPGPPARGSALPPSPNARRGLGSHCSPRFWRRGVQAGAGSSRGPVRALRRPLLCARGGREPCGLRLSLRDQDPALGTPFFPVRSSRAALGFGLPRERPDPCQEVVLETAFLGGVGGSGVGAWPRAPVWSSRAPLPSAPSGVSGGLSRSRPCTGLSGPACRVPILPTPRSSSHEAACSRSGTAGSDRGGSPPKAPLR